MLVRSSGTAERAKCIFKFLTGMFKTSGINVSGQISAPRELILLVGRFRSLQPQRDLQLGRCWLEATCWLEAAEARLLPPSATAAPRQSCLLTTVVLVWPAWKRYCLQDELVLKHLLEDRASSDAAWQLILTAPEHWAEQQETFRSLKLPQAVQKHLTGRR